MKTLMLSIASLLLVSTSFSQVLNNPKFYAPTQIGNNNTQNNIQQEVVYHPTEQLIKRIQDSVKNKMDTIYVKYESSQARKNRNFSIELCNILWNNGYKYLSLQDPTSTIMWGDPIQEVKILGGGSNWSLFVNMY